MFPILNPQNKTIDELLVGQAYNLCFRLFSRCNYFYGYLFEIARLKLEQFFVQEDTQPLSTKPRLI